MIQEIEFKGKSYPLLQSKGFAAQYAMPFAWQICKGVGLDVGTNRNEWKFPPAIPIDPSMNEYDALNLPEGKYDYIFSSHCLEHLADWVEVLDYWKTKLKTGGVLFLYLPHPDQEYWKPWNNRKHVHQLQPQMIEDYLIDRKWKKIFVTKGYDLNHSFYAIAEK